MLRLAALFCAITLLFGCKSTSDAVVAEYQAKDAALAARKTQAPPATAPCSYSLHVKGMGCPLCATNVRKAIERQAGVEAVNIDLGKGIVTVASRPNQEPTESDLRQAVANAGFELAKIERAQ